MERAFTEHGLLALLMVKGRCCSVRMERAFTEHGLLALLMVKVGAVQSSWSELSQNMAFLPCSW